jgi:hypothetical protein
VVDRLQQAGDFTVDKLELITTSGLKVNLIPNVVKLTIFEDINQSCISGTITLQDAINLSSHGPIIGQEFLSMKLRTSSVKDNAGIIDYTKNLLAVHSLTAREKVGNNVQLYNLSFVSMELIRNQRIKVKNSFTLPWSDIVLSMLVNQLQTKKNIFVEKTAGVKKYIAPNIRPLDVINTARDQSVATYKSSPTYLFYETLKGFNFRTLASLYNEKPFMEYTTYVKGALVGKNGVVDLIKDLNNVLGYEIVTNNDTLLNYRTGMYASELIKHDIRNKSISRKVYNYHREFKNEDHIVSGVTKGKTEHPLASSLALNPQGQGVSDFPARTYVVPTSLHNRSDGQHATPENTYPYEPYGAEKWLQRRNSQMTQIQSGFSVNIICHGNTYVNAGQKVKLNLPYTAALKAANDEKNDRFYKGPFLIKNIRHDFDFGKSPQKHRMIMTLVKDSIEEPLDSPSDNYEPFAEGDIQITKQKETYDGVEVKTVPPGIFGGITKSDEI